MHDWLERTKRALSRERDLEDQILEALTLDLKGWEGETQTRRLWLQQLLNHVQTLAQEDVAMGQGLSALTARGFQFFEECLQSKGEFEEELGFALAQTIFKTAQGLRDSRLVHKVIDLLSLLAIKRSGELGPPPMEQPMLIAAAFLYLHELLPPPNESKEDDQPLIVGPDDYLQRASVPMALLSNDEGALTCVEYHRLRFRLFSYLAASSEELSDYMRAIKALQELLNLEPERPELLLELITLYQTMGKLTRFPQHQEIAGTAKRLLESINPTREQLVQVARIVEGLYGSHGGRSHLLLAIQAWQRAFDLAAPSVEEVLAYGAVVLFLYELHPEVALSTPLVWVSMAPLTPETQLLKLRIELSAACKEEEVHRVKAVLEQLHQNHSLYESLPSYWMCKGHCHLFLGHYFQEIAQLEEAIHAFHHILSLDLTANIWPYIARACLFKGELQANIGDLMKATLAFKMGVSYGKYSERFWIEWACALFRSADLMGERGWLSEALTRFDRAINLLRQEGLPIDGDLAYLYGCALDFLGDLNHDDQMYEQAVRWFEYAVNQKQDFESLAGLAVALTHLGEATSEVEPLQKAERLFQHLAQLDHEEENLWNERGVCLLHLGRIAYEDGLMTTLEMFELSQQALNCLEKARRLGNTQATYNLCCAYAALGKKREALHYLSLALDSGVHPSFEEIAEDEWLDPLRGLRHFDELLKHYQNSGEHRLPWEIKMEEEEP